MSSTGLAVGCTKQSLTGLVTLVTLVILVILVMALKGRAATRGIC